MGLASFSSSQGTPRCYKTKRLVDPDVFELGLFRRACEVYWLNTTFALSAYSKLLARGDPAFSQVCSRVPPIDVSGLIPVDSCRFDSL